MSNIHYERKKTFKVKEAWKVSKKLSQILIDHINDKDIIQLSNQLYNEFLGEMKRRKIKLNKSNYNQVWITMINIVKNNPKDKMKRMSIRLLHQTNIQRYNKLINY